MTADDFASAYLLAGAVHALGDPAHRIAAVRFFHIVGIDRLAASGWLYAGGDMPRPVPLAEQVDRQASHDRQVRAWLTSGRLK
jgi:hypothetical protein